MMKAYSCHLNICIEVIINCFYELGFTTKIASQNKGIKFPLLSISNFCSNAVKCAFEAPSPPAAVLLKGKSDDFFLCYTPLHHTA